MSPLVSIIIPCYNAEAYVGEAIESALAQRYPHVEVIVIDDGSTDRSLDVIRGFGRKIRWETGPNSGGCAARNKGMNLACGDIIQFLDADDLLFPNKLELQVPLLMGSQYDCVTCDRIDWARGEGGVTKFDEPDDFIFGWIVHNEGLRTSSPIHKKENLEKIEGFDEELPCSQEYDLHIRLALTGIKVKHISEPLWMARLLPGSVSSNAIRVTLQHPKIFRRARCLAETRLQGVELDRVLRVLAEAFLRDARRCFQFRENSLAMNFIRFAADFHPERGLGFYRYNYIIWLAARMFGVGFSERMVAWRRGRNYYNDPLLRK